MIEDSLTYNIEFEPVGRRGDCPQGKNLLECSRYLGVGLVSICGGFGKCKACRIRLDKGQVSAVTAVEKEVFSAAQIAEGWRLACLTRPLSDCKIYVPPESLTTLQRMQVESHNIVANGAPAVKAADVEIPRPSFSDLRSDAARLLNSLETKQEKPVRIDIDVLRNLSLDLRPDNWKRRAYIREGEVIGTAPSGSRCLGLAVDVGTTKIAGYLIDLENRQTIATRALMNPQISYGEDITSRIHHALKPEEALLLQRAVVDGLNNLARDLCTEAGVVTDNIVEAVLVGNTAIHHLFLRLPVQPLAYPPFVAAIQDSLDVKARDFGLKLAPGAYVHILPNIAGFVGADHVAMLVAIDALSVDKLTLAIDIGTNTEVSLIDKDQIYSASCASGPAFEGGHISCGMRAASGAIERLRIEDGAVQYQTIDSTAAIGICGSGIIDSVSQMYLAGVLNEGGRMQDVPGVRTVAGRKEFVLAPENGENPAVVITQGDVREIQLGKSAIRAGIQVLLDTAGRNEEEIDRVLMAGAFGTYIDVSSAIDLGFLPVLPLERFVQMGNAAGLGARQCLLSTDRRRLASRIAAKMRYVELAGTQSFNGIFVQAQYLGRYRIIGGKRQVLKA